MKKTLIWLLLLSATGLAQPAGQEVVLTAEEALTRALQQHPQLKASQARLRQAEIAAGSAATWPSAQAGLGSWQGRGDTLLNSNYISQNRSDYYLFVQQQLRPPGQNETRSKIASQELEASQAAARLLELQIRQQVKDAYAARLAADQQVRLSQENLQLAQELLQITELRFQAGTSPRLDGLNASIQKNRADQELSAAQSQLLQSQARLAPLLGLPASTNLRCTGELTPQPVSQVYESLRALAKDHPRLQMARSNLEASHHQRQLAQQQGGPTPGIMAIYDLVRPSYAVQLTLSVPIDWGALGAEVEHRAEVEKEKEQTLAAEELQLEADTGANFYAYQRAYDQAVAYRDKILQPAEEVVKVTRYGYVRGAIAYNQLLLVQQQLSTLRKEYVQRVLEVHQALHALELVVGQSLPQQNSGGKP